MTVELELKDGIEKVNNTISAYKEKIESLEAKQSDFVTKDELENNTKKLNDIVTDVKSGVDKLDAKMSSNFVDGVNTKKNMDDARAEFKNWFESRQISSALIDAKTSEARELELKELTGGVEIDGGNTIIQEMSALIRRRLYDTSPVRQVATIETMSTNELDVLYADSRTASGWVAEDASRPKTATPTIQKIIIKAFEIYANPAASESILGDSDRNLEGWLSEKIAEEFMLRENEAFISGDGLVQPKGLLSYDPWAVTGTYEFDKVETIATAGAGVIAYSDIQAIISALKTVYRPNAKFLMNQAIYNQLKEVQVGATGENLARVSFVGSGTNLRQAPTLDGFEVVFCDDMPATTGTGDKVIAFGDFKRAYTIADRRGSSVVRDPYTNKPFIQFYTTKRVGGGVTNFDAYKILQIQ